MCIRDSYYYLSFNVSPDSMFYQNKALRQAVCYAIDVDEIIAGAYDGAAGPMKSIALPTLPGYVDKWQEEDYYSADVEKAQKLEDYIARNLVRASTTKMAQSRRKQLEKLEITQAPKTAHTELKFRFEFDITPYNELLTTHNLCLLYTSRCV